LGNRQTVQLIKAGGKIQKKGLTAEEKAEDLKSEKFRGNARLEAAFDNQPAMGAGEQNDGVAQVQEVLVADGFQMPKSTKPNGEMDGGFGQETKDTIVAFQEKHGLKVDSVVGRETLRRLDAIAIEKGLPQRKPKFFPPKKKEKPLPEGCEFNVEYQNQRSISFCSATSCGGAVQFDIRKVHKRGKTCPASLAGKSLDERVTVISSETTCPNKGGVLTGSCSLGADGTPALPCTDTYAMCFPKNHPDIRSQIELGIIPPVPCKGKMRQELIIDGNVVQVKIITFEVTFFIDLNAPPDFFTCPALVSVT
jgi:hypothetical protein